MVDNIIIGLYLNHSPLPRYIGNIFLYKHALITTNARAQRKRDTPRRVSVEWSTWKPRVSVIRDESAPVYYAQPVTSIRCARCTLQYVLKLHTGSLNRLEQCAKNTY